MPGRSRSPRSARLVSSNGARSWAVLALFGLLLSLVYGGSLRSPLFFDDALSVIGNPSIRQLWPLWTSLPAAAPLQPPVDTPTAGRPLVNLSFALNWHFGEQDPLGYRVVNLLTHALSATLLWSIVRRTLRLGFFRGRFERASEALALLVALLWALHPLHTETVQYVTQRTELLMGLFYLATLYASLRYFQASGASRRRGWLLLAVVACAAGMASKEVMVTAPVLVLLYERTFLAGSLRAALRRSAPLHVGLFATWLLLFVLNHESPRSDSAGFHFDVPAWVWWSTQAKVLWMYLKLAFWPWPLAIHYGTPYLDTFWKALPWVVPAGLLGLGGLVLYARGTAAGYVAAWALAILSPTLVVPIVTEVAAERRMYLPLAGIVALVVVGGYALCAQLAQRRAATAGRDGPASARPLLVVAGCSLAIAVALAWTSAHRLTAYRTALGLWRDTVATQPQSSFAQSNLGNELLNTGHPEEAIGHLERALQLPHFNEFNIRYALGTALALSGRPAEGVEQLEASLNLKPDVAQTHGNLAQALLLLGRREEALVHFAESMRLDPHLPTGLLEYGATLLALERPGEAIAPLQRLAELRPDSLEARGHLGVAYASVGRLTEAIAEFHVALQLAPPAGPVPAGLHRLLGNALMSQHDLPQAVTHLERAVQLDPGDPSLQAALREARDHARRGGRASAPSGTDPP